MRTNASVLLFIAVFLTTAPAFAGGWLIYHDGPYTGKVVDAETGEPIEGAAVLGIWQVKVYGIDTKLKYLDSKEAITEKDGSFEVKAVTGFYWWPFASLARTQFLIFKPGYDSYPPYDLMRHGITGMEQKGFLENNNNLIKLPKLASIEQRKRVLSRVSYPLFSYAEQKISETAKNLMTLITNEKKFLGTLAEGQ